VITTTYDAQLQFFKKTCEKLRVRVAELRQSATTAGWLADGLEYLVQANGHFRPSLEERFAAAQENVLYRATDAFGCCVLFLRLPQAQPPSLLVIGPYLEKPLEREELYERAEQLHVPTNQLATLQTYYGRFLYFPEDSPLYAMVEAFAEHIWQGAENYMFQDGRPEGFDASLSKQDGLTAENPEMAMRMMEERYAFEEQLMDAVSKGLTHKAEMLFSGFSAASFERRLSDPLRNLKNYAIITNTLLRKAAQDGGVHPLYIDSLSSDFARRIEQIPDPLAVQSFMLEMFRAYSRLVRKHSMSGYSQPIQKTIIRIDADLTADLSLHALAEAQGINASYLSALFRRETGETVTDYVNRKRVDLAVHLLSTTGLQVQTVAQHCGFADVHYFTKVFKKLTGQTPRQFRSKEKK
jgi:AraC-like DNA-binding protein